MWECWTRPPASCAPSSTGPQSLPELAAPPRCRGPPPTGWPAALECHAWWSGTATAASSSARRWCGWARAAGSARPVARWRRPGRCWPRCATAPARAPNSSCGRGTSAVCVLSLESPHSLRTIVAVGAVPAHGPWLGGQGAGGPSRRAQARMGPERGRAGARGGIGQRPGDGRPAGWWPRCRFPDRWSGPRASPVVSTPRPSWPRPGRWGRRSRGEGGAGGRVHRRRVAPAPATDARSGRCRRCRAPV